MPNAVMLNKEIQRGNQWSIDRWINSIKRKIREFKILYLYHFFFNHILNGRNIYLQLMKEYGEDCRIYINHYPGTGDVYITAALLPAWTRKNDVEKYVFTVIGKSAYKVSQMFSIKNVKILTTRETEDLLHYLQTIGETNPNIEVLHFSPFAFTHSIMEPLLGENGNNFMDMYLHITFPGLTIKDMEIPKDQTNDGDILSYFRKNKLIPGKTAVLVPYANTIDLLSDQFWNYLADSLRKQGYTVCTNCNYPQEDKIQGTIPVFLPYSEMKKFAETAGVIVQLRSGLSDLICDCDCKNFVLYPVENFFRFGSASLYEYFSLERMGLPNHATEIEFSRRNEFQVYQQILMNLSLSSNINSNQSERGGN